MELVFYWIQWETRGLVEFIYNFWHRPRSLFLTPIPNLCILFNEKIEIEKEKKKFYFMGNAYNRLNSFLLSLLVWLLEDGQRLLVRNASFHCSRTVQLVPIFSRVHISYDCTRALYGSPTHVSTNRVSRHPVYTAARLNGRAWLGWKKRILRWTDRGSICEKSLWNISLIRWGGEERRRREDWIGSLLDVVE